MLLLSLQVHQNQQIVVLQLWLCGSVNHTANRNKHHEEESRPLFCCSARLFESMHGPGHVQGGQEAKRGYLLLGVYHRRIPGSTPTSSWFSSSKPEDTWRDQRADSAQREQRRKEEYWNRESRIPRLRRVKITSSLNEVSARGLTGIITHITKPIVTLNDKTARNDDRRLERNLMHLNKVTEDRIKSALFEDLHGLTEHIQKLDTQVEYLANVHKLSSRVDTRKANSLSVLEEYPTVDTSPTIYRQASSALLNLIKNIVIVKGLTITKDS